MITRSCNLIFEIDQNTFPIVGNPDQWLLEEIQDERRQAASDLWETPQPVVLRYKHPFDSIMDEYGDYPEEVTPFKVIVRQHDKNIIFDVIATVWKTQKEGTYKYIPHPETPEIVLMSAQMSRGVLLGIAREYVSFVEQTETLMAEFAAAEAISKIEGLDETRKLFHDDVNRQISEALEDQGLKIPYKDIEDYRQVRYLSTAIIKHIIPANAFDNPTLTQETYGTKRGKSRDNAYHIQDGHMGHTNPFLRGGPKSP